MEEKEAEQLKNQKTEEYFTSGNIWCVWTVTEKENVIVPVFKYQFNKNMKFGDSNTDVKALQKALKILGFFPQTQGITGLYGNITRDAVNKFQDRYLGYHTGNFFEKSRAILNELPQY